MFWFLFIIFILIAAIIGFIAEFFEQMKESEYEFVRIIYWIFVVSFWIWILSWLIDF
jgi:hypothetical protein